MADTASEVEAPASEPSGRSTGGLASRLRSRQLELVLTAALLAVSALYLAQFVWAMAHEPLWGDEIWSVLNFSSQGPRTALTKVNNAVLPTFISSLLPGGDSLDPLRARLLSMIAVVAMPLLMGYELFRRRWFLAGGLLIYLFSVNYQWLDRTLQARGYGILGFCAAAASLWVWRYLDEHEARWLVGAGVVTVIGIWTVPSFAFFAAPLWLLLLATDRRMRAFWVALAALAAVVMVYAPLASQLLDQSSGYSKAFGKQFSSPVAVVETVGTYLLDLNRNPVLLLAWALALVAAGLVLLPSDTERGPFVGVRRRLAVSAPQPVRQLVRILAGASLGLFVIALVLQTPPTRTVGFVAVPIAVATVAAIAALRDDRRFGSAAAGLMVAAALLGCVHGVAANLQFAYLPIQDWSGAADYIDATFPDGTSVYAARSRQNLAAYLDTDTHPMVRELDQRRLRDGLLVVSDFDPVDERAAARRDLRQSTPNLVEMTLEQRGSGDRGHGWPDPPRPFPILFAPPLDSRVAAVSVEGEVAPDLLDRSVDTGVESAPQNALTEPVMIDVSVAPGTTGRSLLMAVERDHQPRDLEVRVTDPDGTTRTLPSSAVLVAPGVVTVDLGDRAFEEVALSIGPSSSPRTFHPMEVWIYSP